jgi:hypothetical protein
LNEVIFNKAYYIKLGSGGKWFESSLREKKIRIGWPNIPIRLIQYRDWDSIHPLNRQSCTDDGSATRDSNALKNIIEADDKTLFVTFENSCLYWCKAQQNKILLHEDGISKYRLVDGEWSNKDISGSVLSLNRISGKLTKTQRFSGTSCAVKEIDTLKRLINCQTSLLYKNIQSQKGKLINSIETAIKELHWKDFELLVDLIFRDSGWRRVSVLGESMKFMDLDLIDPITLDRYQVQVKSSSTKAIFLDYLKDFDDSNYRRLYYIVHSPNKDLKELKLDTDKDVEIWFAKEISEKVLNHGMLDWLIDKIN